MNSRIIRQGSNWVIIARIEDIADIKEAVDNVDQTYDLSTYTSAKFSKQNYITTPTYIPYYDYKTPIKKPPTWDKVSNRIVNIVQKHLVDHCLMPILWKGLKIKSAWVVTGEEHSFHTVHNHGTDCVSVVIYTSTAEKEFEHQGAIFFVLDASPYSDLSGDGNRLLNFSPQEGDIVIFPGWIHHGVYPQGKGTRQTLALDLVGITRDE